MWVKDLNGHFTKEDIPKSNKNIKGCWAALVIEEMQITTTLGD